MESKLCLHKDVRQFENIRCCMACGETLHLWQVAPQSRNTATLSNPELCDASTRLSHAYNDLRLTTGTAIRLILLQPGDFQDPLSCIIATVDPSREIYDALSYTWATESGDDRKTGRVHCPDGAIAITENCEAALRTIRLPNAPRQLWVDAICINQANFDERNHQVELMEQIYRSASMVHICIQDTTHRYTECIAWLDGRGCFLKEAATQAVELFRRRYFKRVWIIQEIILAKQVTLHVNADSVLLSYAALERMYSLPLELDEPFELPSVLRYLQNPYKMVNIFRCLELSLVASSADLRDRVYGIVSLLRSDIREHIPVDYKMDQTEIFGNVIMACIAEQGNLRILKFVSTPAQSNNAAEACCLGMEEFKNFLRLSGTSSSQSSCCMKRKTAMLFDVNRERNVLWMHQVEVVSISAAAQPTHLRTSPVRKVSTKLPVNQILPHLQIRANLIDISHGSSNHSIKLFAARIQRDHVDVFTQCPWLKEVFQVEEERDTMKHDYDREDCPIMIVGLDLQQFSDDAICCDTPDSATMFQSYHSIGFSSVKHAAGDHIFAVDSINELFILRPVGFNVFRVVGTCYLWAAMELDYWNPGSRKGRWMDRPYDLGTEQTRIIEIY